MHFSTVTSRPPSSLTWAKAPRKEANFYKKKIYSMELKVEAADWEIPVGSGSYNLARRVSSEGLAEWILLSGESTVSIDVLEFGK